MTGKIAKIGVLFFGFLLAGCASSVPEKQSANNSAQIKEPTAQVAASPRTPLEKELDYIGKGGFRQVFVFSRKDGGKLTSEDVDYFKQHAPSEQINQRLRTEDGKYLVAGTNFAFRPEQLDALRKRFAAEDFTEKYGRKSDANSNVQSSPQQ